MNELVAIFKALSDDTRLRILKLLEHGELCVCDIGAALAMVQPKVSFHLAALKDAGLIRDRKQGRWTHYMIADADMFRRFLTLTVIEKIPAQAIADDRKKLEDFLKKKAKKASAVSSRGKINCYGA